MKTIRVLCNVLCCVLLVLLAACDSGPPATPTGVIPATPAATLTVVQPDATAVPPTEATGPAAPTAPPPAIAPAPPTLPPQTQLSPAPMAVLGGHPRLLISAGDVPRLRAWAVSSNPIWAQGLVPLATAAKADMDAGRVPGQDLGSREYEEYGVEKYAELFAFLALIDPDPAARDDYARRARTLLMAGLNAAAKGPADGQPFRAPDFFAPTSNRSRWRGEAWMLTVDWIYPTLTTEDKATIRRVFLLWSDEIVQNGYHHPEPVGVLNSSALVSNVANVRWAANNYFSADMRNLGLMALALDPADDPGNGLGQYLNVAIGAHLYMIDALYHHDARGGLAAEGFEYGPQAIGYVAQFLYILRVAGQADPGRWGPQVGLLADPFWNDLLLAFFHTTSPVPVPIQDMGPVYQPAFYGDGQNYVTPDFIELFTPLGLYDAQTGNTTRLATLRWIETNMVPGGAAGLLERVSRTDDFRDAIFYFLLLDPAAPPAPDPRPAQPLTFFAPGLGRIYARTGWGPDATWFGYTLGWNTIDHQHGDGNDFHFYRQGEFLTKEVTSYDMGSSDAHNTLALQNDPPDHNDPGDYRHDLWLRGSQWAYDPSGDGTILAHSFGKDFVYALGDATNLYNTAYDLATDITQASRSIVWLEPDVVLTYDRASSKTANRFKRYWLHLPAAPTITGNHVQVTTPKGQQLFVTSLLPQGAVLTGQAVQAPTDGEVAHYEPMTFQLKIEAAGNPQDVRFLTVLQGANAGMPASPVTAIQSTGGPAYAGAVIAGRAVVFPVNLGGSFTGVEFAVPGDTKNILVTGVQPGGSYAVNTQQQGGQIAVKVSAGTTQRADDGGVLVVNVP